MDKFVATLSQTMEENGLNRLLQEKVKQRALVEKNIAFLSNIPESAMIALMGATKTVTFLKAGRMASEIQKVADCYIIFFGVATVLFGSDQSAREFMIEVRDTRTGDGEIAVLNNDLLLGSHVTLEKVLFAVISLRDFRNWLLKFSGERHSNINVNR